MPSSLLELEALPNFQNAPREERVRMVMDLYDSAYTEIKAMPDATPQILASVKESQVAALKKHGVSKLPSDIGGFENFSNAATKTFGEMWQGNVGFGLLKSGDLAGYEAYVNHLEAKYPTREGLTQTFGSAAAAVGPSLAALAAAYYSGGTTVVAGLAAGATMATSTAGGTLLSVREQERLTGEDIGTARTAAIVAGHAALEFATEYVSLGMAAGVGKWAGKKVFASSVAESLGNIVMSNPSREALIKGVKTVFQRPAMERTMAIATGWIGIGANESVEEGVNQAATNFVDNLLLKPTYIFEGVGESMKGGFAGGLILGPFAMGFQTAQYGRVIDAYKADEQQKFGELQRSQPGIQAQYNADAWADAGFRAAREMAAKAGHTLIPVRNSGNRGQAYTPIEGTHSALVDIDAARQQWGELGPAMVAAHEWTHLLRATAPDVFKTLSDGIIADGDPRFEQFRKTYSNAARPAVEAQARNTVLGAAAGPLTTVQDAAVSQAAAEYEIEVPRAREEVLADWVAVNLFDASVQNRIAQALASRPNGRKLAKQFKDRIFQFSATSQQTLASASEAMGEGFSESILGLSTTLTADSKRAEAAAVTFVEMVNFATDRFDNKERLAQQLAMLTQTAEGGEEKKAAPVVETPPSPAPVPAEQPVTVVQTTSGDSTVEQPASAEPVAGAGVSVGRVRLDPTAVQEMMDSGMSKADAIAAVSAQSEVSTGGPTLSAPISDPNRPRVHKVFFPAYRGASVDAMVRFVTLDQVLSSVDPGHNKDLLQPRGPDEKALEIKVQQMIAKPELGRVIATAPTMSEGLPLVIRLADGEPMQSVSGTARLEFFKRARKIPKLWAEIQKLTQEMAAREGQTVPPNAIPVFELQAYQYLDEMMSLADLRTSAKTLYTIADEANKAAARDTSVAEQAQIDATRISFERDKLLPFINTGETGDFASASNDKFMSAFLNMVQVQAARAKSGRIVGDAAVDRATNALLAFTLREAKTPFTTIRQFIESAQTLGLRNVSEGIVGAIGPLVAQAATKPDLSIVIEIGRTATAFADYRNAVEFADEKLDFAAFALRDASRGWTPVELKLITLFGNATSGKQIRDALLRYARVASSQRSEDRMLVEPPKKEDILEGKPAQFKGQIAEQTGLTLLSPSEPAAYERGILDKAKQKRAALEKARKDANAASLDAVLDPSGDVFSAWVDEWDSLPEAAKRERIKEEFDAAISAAEESVSEAEAEAELERVLEGMEADKQAAAARGFLDSVLRFLSGVSVKLRNSSQGSEYFTVTDNGSGESVKIRVSDHRQKQGGGFYRSDTFGEGRIGNSDVDIVFNADGFTAVVLPESGAWTYDEPVITDPRELAQAVADRLVEQSDEDFSVEVLDAPSASPDIRYSPSESASYQTPIQTLAGIPIPDNASTTGWTAGKDTLTLRVQEAGELLPTDFVVTTNGDTPEPTRGEVYVVSRLAVGTDVADVAKHIQERLFSPSEVRLYRGDVKDDPVLDPRGPVFFTPRRELAERYGKATGYSVQLGRIADWERDALPLLQRVIADKIGNWTAEELAEYNAWRARNDLEPETLEEMEASAQYALQARPDQTDTDPFLFLLRGQLRAAGFDTVRRDYESGGGMRTGDDEYIVFSAVSPDIRYSPSEPNIRQHDQRARGGENLYVRPDMVDPKAPVERSFANVAEAGDWLIQNYRKDYPAMLRRIEEMQKDGQLPDANRSYLALIGKVRAEVYGVNDAAIVRDATHLGLLGTVTAAQSALASNFGSGLQSQKDAYPDDPVREGTRMVSEVRSANTENVPTEDITAAQNAAQTAGQDAAVGVDVMGFEYFLRQAELALDRDLAKEFGDRLRSLPDALPGGLQSPDETVSRILRNWRTIHNRFTADPAAAAKEWETLGYTGGQIDAVRDLVAKKAAAMARVDAQRARSSPVADVVNKAAAPAVSALQAQADAADRQLAKDITRIVRNEVRDAVALVAVPLPRLSTAIDDVNLALSEPDLYEAKLVTAYNAGVKRLIELQTTKADEPSIAEAQLALESVQSDLDDLQDRGYPRAALRKALMDVERNRADAVKAMPGAEAFIDIELAEMASLEAEQKLDAAMDRTARAWAAQQILIAREPKAQITPAELLRQIVTQPNRWGAALGRLPAEYNNMNVQGLPPALVAKVMGDILDDVGLPPYEFSQLPGTDAKAMEVVRRLRAIAGARTDEIVAAYKATVRSEATAKALKTLADQMTAKMIRDTVHTVENKPLRTKEDVLKAALENPDAAVAALDASVAGGVERLVAMGMTEADAQAEIARMTSARDEIAKYGARRADVAKALYREIKALNKDISGILHSGLAYQQTTAVDVAGSIVARLGLQGPAATAAQASIEKVLKEEIGVQARKEFDRIAKSLEPKAARERRGAHERLIELAALGNLNDATGRRVLAKALGIETIPDSLDAELDALLADLERTARVLGDGRTETAVKFQNLKVAVFEGLRKQGSWGKQLLDRLMPIYFTSLLAGPGTFLLNVKGNTAQAALGMLNESIRRAWDGNLGLRDIQLAIRMMPEFMKDAVAIEAKSAMVSGVAPSRVAGKFKDMGYRADPRTLKTVPLIGPFLSKTAIVGDLLSATDAVFYHVAKEFDLLIDTIAAYRAEGMSTEDAYDAAVKDLAYKETEAFKTQARAKYAELGVTPTENQVDVLALELRDDARKANEVDLEAGYRAGREATFTPLKIKGPVIRALVDMLNSAKTKFPVLNFVLPFTTIAGVITDNALDYMPPSAILRTTGSYFDMKAARKKMGEDSAEAVEARKEFQRATIKMTEGTLLVAAVILALIAEGDKEEKDRVFYIHGPGPRDFKKNAQWRLAGGRPYTMTIAGVNFDYRAYPSFLALGTLGALLDAMKYERDGGEMSAQEIVMTYTLATMTVTAEQSFLVGLKDIHDIMFETNPDQKLDKMKDVGARIVANSLIPGANFFRQIQRQIDPTVRQTDYSLPAKVMAQVPVLSLFMPEKISALGSVVRGDRPLFDPSQMAEDPDDVRVFETLIAKDLWLTVPSVRETPLINKSDLRRSEYRRLAPEMSGKTMDIEQVSQFIKERGARFKARALPRLEAWEKLDREVVKAEVAKYMDQASREARRVVLGLNPRR